MHAYALEALVDKLKPGARVLDVGSGTGYLTAAFAIMVGPNGKAVGKINLSHNHNINSILNYFYKVSSISKNCIKNRLRI